MANRVCINGKGWDQWKAEVGIGIKLPMWEGEIFFGTCFDEGEALVKEQLAKINLIQNEAWHVSDGSQRWTKSTSAFTWERIRGYFTEPDKTRMWLRNSSHKLATWECCQLFAHTEFNCSGQKLIWVSILIEKSIFIPRACLIQVW